MQATFKTPVEMLNHWVDAQGDQVYLRQPVNGQYRDFSWRDVKRKMEQLAGALRHLGLESGGW